MMQISASISVWIKLYSGLGNRVSAVIKCQIKTRLDALYFFFEIVFTIFKIGIRLTSLSFTNSINKI